MLRKSIFVLFMALTVGAFTVTSCSDDDTDMPNTSGGTTNPTPVVSQEMRQFAGIWEGVLYNSERGEYYSSTFSLYSDGTTNFTTYDEAKKQQVPCKWTYTASDNMLILYYGNGNLWTISRVKKDEWIGTFLNTDGGTYVYRRVSPAPYASSVRVADYRGSSLLVRDTVHHFRTWGRAFRCGVAVGERGNEEVSTYRRVYADGVTASTGTTDVTGLFDVEIKGLTPDADYTLVGFVETEDSISYGPTFRAKNIVPPANSVFMGDIDGANAMFWLNGDLTADGRLYDPTQPGPVMSQRFMRYTRYVNKYVGYETFPDSARIFLDSLDNGWELPQSVFDVGAIEMIDAGGKDVIKVTSAINGNVLYFPGEECSYAVAPSGNRCGLRFRFDFDEDELSVYYGILVSGTVYQYVRPVIYQGCRWYQPQGTEGK